MNEVMEETLRNNLRIALKYNKLIEYLAGRGVYFVPSNKNEEKTPHAFYNSMLVFNKVNQEVPSLKLSKKYVEELETKINDKMLLTEIYGIFKCVLAQTKIEQEGKSTLDISMKDKKKIMETLKRVVEENKALLQSSKYLEGEMYNDGVYGFMNSESHKLK